MIDCFEASLWLRVFLFVGVVWCPVPVFVLCAMMFDLVCVVLLLLRVCFVRFCGFGELGHVWCACFV